MQNEWRFGMKQEINTKIYTIRIRNKRQQQQQQETTTETSTD